jgi:putative ABC transport system permease protein
MPKTDLIPGVVGFWATLRIGWRNLSRSRRRTLLTASTVAVAVLLLEVSMALLRGIENQSFDNLINYQTAHAKVYAAGYFEHRSDEPLDYMIENVDALESEALSVEGVSAVTSRIQFSAQLSDGVDQVQIVGLGIDISGSDSDVFRLEEAIVDGTYLRPAEEGMLVGSNLAEFFDAAPGDYLTILAKTRYGAYEAIDLQITGIVGTGNPLIDRSSVLIPMYLARETLDLGDAATELDVRFAARANEERTLRRLKSRFGDQPKYEVKGWREVEDDFMALVEFKRTAQGVFLSIFVIMAIVGIANTIVIATFERTREIGTLMALGFRGGGIRRLFLVEGALTGFVGGAIGTMLAVGVVAYFAATGIDMSALYGDMDIGYPVKDILYPALSTAFFAGTWIMTGLLSAAASLWPAYRASRLEPVDALRHV